MREEVEVDLTFLGLIVLENRLKPETTGVMKILKKAAIRTIMVTGKCAWNSQSHGHFYYGCHSAGLFT